MYQFLERYLEKKIHIAEALYIHGEELPIDEIKEELDISNTTFNSYLSEVKQMYQEYCSSNNRYSSSNLKKVTSFYIDQSSKSQLLFTLFLYPGNDAKFYKEILALSDATFSRMIAQLKENLKPFNTSIIITNGYRIRGENEAHLVVFFTHLLIFFHWDVSILYEEVEKMVGAGTMENIKNIDFSDYIFVEDSFEESFFHVTYAISLLRKVQRDHFVNLKNHVTCEVNIDCMSNYLEEMYEKAKEKIDTTLLSCQKEEIDRLFINNPERIRKLLILSSFQISLFPYDMGQVPARSAMFFKKVQYSFPDIALLIESFILRISEHFNEKYALRFAMIAYFLIIEKSIQYKTLKEIQIYLYSDLGKSHQQYLMRQFEQIQGFFHPKTSFNFIKDSFSFNNTIAEKTFFLTNTYLDNIPDSHQYVLNDAVSISDFIHIILWLRMKSIES